MRYLGNNRVIYWTEGQFSEGSWGLCHIGLQEAQTEVPTMQLAVLGAPSEGEPESQTHDYGH
jgi:hypothetical protein